MKTFKMFQHPTKGFEAVKVGFSWPAFFFNFIWMFVKKLWLYGGLWFGAYIACAIIEAVIDNSRELSAQASAYLVLAVAYFALCLVPAFKGNAWREENLKQRGYTYLGDIQAENPDSAIAQQAAQEKSGLTVNKSSSEKKSPPKPQPFVGFQDIPSTQEKSPGDLLQLPKGKP